MQKTKRDAKKKLQIPAELELDVEGNSTYRDRLFRSKYKFSLNIALHFVTRPVLW
jgi:hypothetical protein